MAVTDVILIASVVFLSYLFFGRSKRSPHPLPPHPKPLPLLGNILDFPTSNHARAFKKLHEKLDSPIVCLSALGQIWIDISSYSLGKEILVRRGGLNSARLRFPYFDRYINPLGRYWGFEDENDIWRRGKELTALAMDFVRKGEAHGLQEMESKRTLFNILEMKDDRWKDHIMRFGASVMTALAYGFSCPSIDFPKLVQLNSLSQAAANGILAFSIINFFPILDYLPGPMPWRTFTKPYRQKDKEFYETLHQEAAAGKNVGNTATWLKTIFADKPGDARLVDQLVAAGAETTGMAIATFVLAWVMYPEAMESVRAQVDSVCGNEFPSYKHRDQLPLVDALVAETLRWRPDVPQGIPHRSTVAQTITLDNGETYSIPADAILTINALCVDMEPGRFPDPTRFYPERHLENGRFKHCELATFGWSKRRCPGAPFAEDSMFIMIANLLWAFDVAKDDNFNYEKVAFEADFANEELVFPAVFTPRSAEKAKEIRRYDAEESTLPRE
ncbi:cytochrome P450 [Atractiella rhizophila]|nr:cytochrome P450 [Atractiella rhizophila]